MPARVTMRHQKLGPDESFPRFLRAAMSQIIGADPGAPFNRCSAHKAKTVSLHFFLAVNCYMYCDNMSRINNQFSVGVHIMTALGDHHGEPVTSGHLTASVRAHESRVRSVLSKLVKAGLVVTSRGRNGFSSLSRPANKISLLEIYKAVEAPRCFFDSRVSKRKDVPNELHP